MVDCELFTYLILYLLLFSLIEKGSGEARKVYARPEAGTRLNINWFGYLASRYEIKRIPICFVGKSVVESTQV